jgi:hypothetical protein
MLDLLAVAMANEALRRHHDRFDGGSGREPARPSPSLGRVRLGVARRLRAVADLIEPIGAPAGSEPEGSPTMAIDRRDAA